MKVLITGADGFIGKNLQIHLKTSKIDFDTFTRNDELSSLADKVKKADFIFHLAGVNRPKEITEFKTGNAELTGHLCSEIVRSGKKIPVVYTSSIQAELPNDYGVSKLDAEKTLLKLEQETGTAVHIYRLPNVFGKWSRPNYNSVVATFCHNIYKGLPIQINDPAAKLRLVYVDDVISEFLQVLDGLKKKTGLMTVDFEFETTVGELAEKIQLFKESKQSLITEKVGKGLDRALYSTYLSFYSPSDFSYSVKAHTDPRGTFVEMLKTSDSGQFSYFTAHPGVTRGGHFHHTKNEKFLVLKGEALFKFRQIVTNEFYELRTSGNNPVIVETVPGWTHDITNVGEEEMIVMLWANEIFDREKPDTFAEKV